MEKEGAMEEGGVEDWFAERFPSMSVLLVMMLAVMVAVLVVLFCERCNMGIIGQGAYGAGGDVMVDKGFVVFADDIDSDIYEFRNK
jgi:hypothetical protein